MASDTEAAEASDKKTKKPKTITHEFTRGAIALLKEYLPKQLWYKDQPVHVALHAINVLENQLADIEGIPVPEDGEKFDAYKERVEPLADEVHKIELSEDERKACRECVKQHLKHGVWELTTHVRNLITELEVG